MAKPEKTHWGYIPPGAIVVPPVNKRETGWLAGEKPPNQYMNWVHNEGAKWEDFFEAKTENIEPVIIRSDNSIAWDSGTGELSFTAHLQIIFRNGAGSPQINQFNSGTSPLTIADGQVVVVKRDRSGASPVNLGVGAYGSLVAGEYAIIPESSMTAADEENEMVFVRRRGAYLEFPYLGLIVNTGTTFVIGLQSSGGVGPHTHDAADIISGTFADARISQSSVTQHQAALALAASQIVSGTLTDARIAASNVTQHNAALDHNVLQNLATGNPHTQYLLRDVFASNRITNAGSDILLGTSNDGAFADVGSGAEITFTVTQTGKWIILCSFQPAFDATVNLEFSSTTLFRLTDGTTNLDPIEQRFEGDNGPNGNWYEIPITLVGFFSFASIGSKTVKLQKQNTSSQNIALRFLDNVGGAVVNFYAYRVAD